jgi:hypothetical protein
MHETIRPSLPMSDMCDPMSRTHESDLGQNYAQNWNRDFLVMLWIYGHSTPNPSSVEPNCLYV